MAVRRRRLLLALIATAIVVLLAGPALYRAAWRARSSNPVRRGISLARELGCFQCHGELGRAGLPDPRARSGAVPSWPDRAARSAWTRDDLRRIVLDGGVDGPRPPGEPAEHALSMPPYRGVVGGERLDALLDAVIALSGFIAPPAEGSADRGLEVARRRGCFGCHGAAGSGGLPNPGSATGFVPGWYGADFEHLVVDRSEFDGWIRDGSIPRLAANPLAAWFTNRQRIKMPAYDAMTDAELDDLWAFAGWLAATGGGSRADRPD